MYIVHRVLLCITYSGILSHCLGETTLIPGPFDGNHHYGNTVIFCSSISCRQYTAVIAGSIVGGGLGIILLLLCILFCYCRCRRRPSQTNVKFVNAIKHKNNEQKLSDLNLFKSGIWSSRYLQFGIWHGPDYFSLSFDPQSFQITGSGSDNIGMFIIDGTYSIQTGRIGLTKIYQLNTGNRSGNLERQTIIQLIWNSETRQFEGKRYVRTRTYREENRFDLKFSKQQRLSPNEKI